MTSSCITMVLYNAWHNHTQHHWTLCVIPLLPRLGWQAEASERSAAEHRQWDGRASYVASTAAAVRGEPGAAALRTVPASLLHGLTAKWWTAQSKGNSNRPRLLSYPTPHPPPPPFHQFPQIANRWRRWSRRWSAESPRRWRRGWIICGLRTHI